MQTKEKVLQGWIADCRCSVVEVTGPGGTAAAAAAAAVEQNAEPTAHIGIEG